MILMILTIITFKLFNAVFGNLVRSLVSIWQSHILMQELPDNTLLLI
jgi:hypothetical protein